MATIREGKKAALVVVDVQVGVVSAAWDRDRVVGNVALAVSRARAQGAPVVWVQHMSDELPRESAPWQWVPELVPAASDVRIHKQFNSGFEQTELDAELASLGVAHVVLAGAQSNWCIRATAHGALERGYDLTLISDAHTAETMALDDGTTLAAADMVRELNVAIQWLEYPGRKNAVAAAATINFDGAAEVADLVASPVGS